jgi:hypothetical protein
MAYVFPFVEDREVKVYKKEYRSLQGRIQAVKRSSKYGQIFPIMDSKIVLGKYSPLIYFRKIHFCVQKIMKILVY